MNSLDRRLAMHMAVVLAAGSLFAACGEIPHDAPRPFAGKDETRSYAGAPFNGDKALYEKTLADRADTQNEYLSTVEEKKITASPGADVAKTARADR